MNEESTVYVLYRRLLRLYPREFREWLEESMQQTFHDLYRERQAESAWFGFILWAFAETGMGIVREHVLLIRQGDMMKHILANHNLAAITSLMLATPV